MGFLGYPLLVIALPHKERPVNDLFNAQRKAWELTVVPSNLAVRKCMERLRANGCIALAADRDFTANGEILDFFGKKTLIPKGAAVFSLKTGVPIIPVFLIRDSDNQHTLTVEEPIYPPHSAEAENKETLDPELYIPLMKQYAKVIEQKIREYPTQWLMFREFWIK